MQEVTKSPVKLNIEWRFLGSQGYANSVETKKFSFILFHPFGRKAATGTKIFSLFVKVPLCLRPFAPSWLLHPNTRRCQCYKETRSLLHCETTAPSSSPCLGESAGRSKPSSDASVNIRGTSHPSPAGYSPNKWRRVVGRHSYVTSNGL